MPTVVVTFLTTVTGAAITFLTIGVGDRPPVVGGVVVVGGAVPVTGSVLVGGPVG